VKARTLILFILCILVVDQAVKIWVKTHMPLSYDWDAYHTLLTPYDKGIRPFGGEWFQLSFVENDGMAWGWKLGGSWGKMALTLFRLIAVVVGVFMLKKFLQKQHHKGFVICAALIFAGALGNLIDSIAYGVVFDESTVNRVATLFPAKGYAGLFQGKVVDMLYFPIIKDKVWPSWVPFVGGDRFTFFSAVFNIADACISIGVITILLFQNKFFKKDISAQLATAETNSTVTDHTQVL
jgi:signal peptidase II